MAAVVRGVANATPLSKLTPLLRSIQVKPSSVSAFIALKSPLDVQNSSLLKKEQNDINVSAIKFSPHSINIFNELPFQSKLPIMEMPRIPISTILPVIRNIPVMEDPLTNKEIDCPTDGRVEEKHAVRMIVIRRRKMRIHKLKKLRKKMKYEWAKRRLRRKIKKEKIFQLTLFNKFKEAQNFSAEKYVEDKLKAAKEIPIPNFWKGKRMPKFLIRQYMGLDPMIEYKQFKNFNKNGTRRS